MNKAPYFKIGDIVIDGEDEIFIVMSYDDEQMNVLYIYTENITK